MIFKHAISWFEIPTLDINRAQKFYEAIFDIEMIPFDTPQIQMRMFPIESMMNIGGAITYNKEFYTPSTEGVLVYLNGNPDVQIILDRVEAAGGTITLPKTMISPEHGYMALFTDTEATVLHYMPYPRLLHD